MYWRLPPRQQRYSFNQSGYNWQRSVGAVGGCVSEIAKNGMKTSKLWDTAFL
jgi:hypothetical protein